MRCSATSRRTSSEKCTFTSEAGTWPFRSPGSAPCPRPPPAPPRDPGRPPLPLDATVRALPFLLHDVHRRLHRETPLAAFDRLDRDFHWHSEVVSSFCMVPRPLPHLMAAGAGQALRSLDAGARLLPCEEPLRLLGSIDRFVVIEQDGSKVRARLRRVKWRGRGG